MQDMGVEKIFVFRYNHPTLFKTEFSDFGISDSITGWELHGIPNLMPRSLQTTRQRRRYVGIQQKPHANANRGLQAFSDLQAKFKQA